MASGSLPGWSCRARGIPGRYPGLRSRPHGYRPSDVAFTFTFSEYQDGRQTGTAWYATGPQARAPESAGEMLAESFPVSFNGTAPPAQAGPARLLAGGAATRSSPISRAPCTASPGPGTTTSPATT
jgi:hypothetical protein